VSIVVKTIKHKKYAYHAYRSRNKVVHKYLGPLSDPAVATKMEALQEMKTIPKRFYFLFWDTPPGRVDLRSHARYVIERVLEMGSLDALHWIQRLYPTKLIMETCENSRKISPKSDNFWRIWFGRPC